MNIFFSELIEKTMALLAIDSVQAQPCPTSPFGQGVSDCLNFVDKLAKKFGFATHNENGYYVTADIGEGEQFGILGHVDVVPHDDEWDSNPLGELRDGGIYGRGILDDKGPMLACLFAVHQLLSEGLTPKKQIRFIFGGNEETGWECIERYKQVDTMPKEGFSPDGDFPVINCEKGLANYSIILDKPTRLVSISGGSRANVVMPYVKAVVDGALDVALDGITNFNNLDVTAKDGKTILSASGIPAHASTPQLGKNALWSVLNFLSEAIGEEYSTLAKLFCNNDGSGLDLALEDAKSGKLTCNLGVVKLTDDDKLSLTLDVRFPISFDKNFIADALRSKLPNAKVEIIHFHDPHYISPDTTLVSTLLGVYNKAMSTSEKSLAIGGGTYARALECGVAFGPMFPNQPSTIHQKNEFVSLKDFEKMYDIYYEAIKALLF